MGSCLIYTSERVTEMDQSFSSVVEKRQQRGVDHNCTHDDEIIQSMVTNVLLKAKNRLIVLTTILICLVMLYVNDVDSAAVVRICRRPIITHTNILAAK